MSFAVALLQFMWELYQNKKEENILLTKLKIFLEMIKFEHSIFALPFAYIATLLTEQKLPSMYHLFWITVAMVGARTAAMSLNRMIDRKIDAKNPRTKNRAMPKGLLSSAEVTMYTVISLAVLALSAYQLSPLAWTLLPLVLFALTFYSYTKRFTWACHFFLGFTLGLAPIGAWVAITNEVSVVSILLAAGVFFWVAGFDIIYACDDYDFDRENGIFSVPSRFGLDRALWIARVLHVLAPICFFALGILAHLGIFYFVGLISAVILLYYQHRLVSPNDLSQTGIAFFNLNGTLSMVMFVCTFLEVCFR